MHTLKHNCILCEQSIFLKKKVLHKHIHILLHSCIRNISSVTFSSVHCTSHNNSPSSRSITSNIMSWLIKESLPKMLFHDNCPTTFWGSVDLHCKVALFNTSQKTPIYRVFSCAVFPPEMRYFTLLQTEFHLQMLSFLLLLLLHPRCSTKNLYSIDLWNV